MFVAQMLCFDVFGMKEVFGGVKGCRHHNRVFGAQMRCWPWGERGVWLEKRGVWGKKRCLGAYRGVWDIYFFQQKSLGGTKEVPRVPESPA